ncbi:FG-GAP-like repeat-containing protein [Pendulispora rubella]|uniref:FG-GAP-like repeat-containing protein n=1 Tax=Pendulispora rubella TaxID=2741070 RepID=A0ABZ2KZ76_9BACT
MTRSWWASLLVVFGAAACGAGDEHPVALEPVSVDGFSCAPFQMQSAQVRMATGSAVALHAVGGSGVATFGLAGETGGASIEPGGGLRAGKRAASFEAIARDGRCRAEARTRVEVIGPFAVEPASIVVARGTRLSLAPSGALGRVSYTVLERPGGREGALGKIDAKDDAASFVAGDEEGTYRIAARDVGSGHEALLTVTVGKPVPLRPRAELYAVPARGRVRLDFRGGSARVEPVSVGGAGGRVTLESGDAWFEAGAAPGMADVTVRDRFTKETAKVRVLVAETLGAPSLPRGMQSGLGDLASGDVNGDGKPDIVVGHSERSKVAMEAGGILVYAGSGAPGAVEAVPAVIEGERPADHLGAVLAVRDLNGDGIDDIVAGIPDADLGDADRGAVAVYLGSSHGVAPEPDRVMAGEGMNHHFGAALALGDLDGDGAPDLAVSAPTGRSSFEPGCEGGRVSIFRNRKTPRAVFESVPEQTLDMRPVQSDSDAVPACGNGPTGAGRALALIDMDGDKTADLVVGLPQVSFPQPGKAHGQVLVFRGLGGARFETDPAWALELDGPQRRDNAAFGSGLDVVRAEPRGSEVLVVRAPGLGFFSFAPGSLGPRGHDRRAHVVTTAAARAFYVDDRQAARGIARSAALGDVDPAAGFEYVVSAPENRGGVLVFSASGLLDRRGALTPLADGAGRPNEFTGLRIAAVGAGALAVWSPWRNTAQGNFAGAIDVVAAEPAPFKGRWPGKEAIVLPTFGAGDRAGQAVELGVLDGKSITLVGAPGANVPSRLRAGAVDLFGADAARSLQRVTGERQDAQFGRGAMAVLDFDGDGQLDLAVGDADDNWGGPTPKGFADPDGCSVLDAAGKPVQTAHRGSVRIYSVAAGKMVERFRLVAPRESPRNMKGWPPYARGRFGFSLAVADVNGDKLDDLVVGRPNAFDGSGAEVILGRKHDAGNDVRVACNVGEMGKNGALVIPSMGEGAPTSYGSAVARVGDLDKDGCDEVAISLSSTGGFPEHAGVVVAFGYDAEGKRCRGHDRPFVLRLVADDHTLADDVVGDPKTRANDLQDLRQPTTMGRVLARGSGDFTGDGVPDVVFRDGDLTLGEMRGPAVEILSGAYLASLCPNHRCPRGRHGALFSDGDWNVVAMRPLGAPVRRVLFAGPTARGGIASVALGDANRDGVADLAMGVPDDSDQGEFAGAVRVYLGGNKTSVDPYVMAVGDLTETSVFGVSVALSPSALVVGASGSTRGGKGANLGAAYRWNLEASK